MSCFTIGPSGLGGRLWPHLGAFPGDWPSSRPPAGFLSRCGRPALRAADPAGCWIRAGSPEAGRTATAGAVPAWAPAAWPAVRPLLPVRGWPSLESQTPAWLSLCCRLLRLAPADIVLPRQFYDNDSEKIQKNPTFGKNLDIGNRQSQ
jgi:hypothetical protein